MDDINEKLINSLKKSILEKGSPACIMAAWYLVTEIDRDILPDWVLALAGGDIDRWSEAIAEAIADMEAEEEQDD